MRLYREILPFIMSCLWAAAACAQTGKLSGSLKDEAGQPVPFANVAVLSLPDSAVTTGSVADFDGKFAIASPTQGTYLLRLSAVGYTTRYSESFDVSGPAFSKTFTTFTLKEESQMLQEVTVEAMRPRVVMEADKMVVSVEGTALAAGSSAFEVLAKSPGVWVDQDGELHLNGQAGVKVMIDGRVTYLSGKELQGLLESMSAENIENIEIIANPSAKYDAEGTAGILNINLKKNTISGMNGSVYANYTYNSRHAYSLGTNLNYKKGKWNTFLNLDYGQRQTRREMYIARDFGTATFIQDGKDLRTYKTPSVRAGVDYQLNGQHSLGVMVNRSQNNYSVDWSTQSVLDEAEVDQDIYARNYRDNANGNTTINMHYTGQLDTAGTTLSADINYIQLQNSSDGRFINEYTYSDQSAFKEIFDTQNPSGFDIYSAQLDLTTPLKSIQGKLEVGLKASHVKSDSDLRFYKQEQEGAQLMPERSNHFIYDESIFAAYANVHTQLSDRWNLQAGLRAEKTLGEGYSLTLDETTPRSYLNLFPSVFLKQKVNDNYQISYSYSRRVQRPDYGRLNPFFFYLDPYTSVIGNPYLKPAYTHSMGITQTFKQMFNVRLGYDVSSDQVLEISSQDDESKQTLITFENIKTTRNLSLTVNAPVQLLPKWSVNATATVAKQQYVVQRNATNKTLSQLFYRAQTTHNIKLPKGFGLEVNAAYEGPMLYGIFFIKPRGTVDFGLKKSFMNDKLNVNLTVNDALQTSKIQGDIDLGERTSYLSQYMFVRAARLSLRYNFTKGEKFSSQSRKVKLEELQRAGG